MSETGDKKKQIRVEDDVYAKLVLIQKNCDWPTSLTVIGSFAMRKGMAEAKRTFNPPERKFAEKENLT
jgi:hypothetical protein